MSPYIMARDHQAHLLPNKEGGSQLRRVGSDGTLIEAAAKIDHHCCRVLQQPAQTHEAQEEEDEEEEEEAAEVVACECCGLSEECTPAYVGSVRELCGGAWACGLCMEAVKERAERDPTLSVREALEAHTAFSKRFSETTRLNPKLSFAGAMREVARRSSLRREKKLLASSSFSSSSSSVDQWMRPAVTRASSCNSRINC